MGGAWYNDVLGAQATTADVENIAMKSIAKQLNITAQPVHISANIIKVGIVRGHIVWLGQAK